MKLFAKTLLAAAVAVFSFGAQAAVIRAKNRANARMRCGPFSALSDHASATQPPLRLRLCSVSRKRLNAWPASGASAIERAFHRSHQST